ncbi:MAG TPA: hypothetical protein VE650_20755 [Acetobacteraceae bacterium]|jgi:hypothetical protein|nr:hypothetical protein [Acetobacteraceae bacterium]
MKNILLTGAVLSLAVAAPAFAGEGNNDPFAPNGTITTGGVLGNPGDGVVQSLNSLPPGWENGTPAYEYAQQVNRYFAEQARRSATQTANAVPR